MKVCVGIDLGTTNSAIAYINELGVPEILKNRYNEATTPSAIYFKKDGTVKIGRAAKEMEEFGEFEVASFYKREIGNSSFEQNYHGKRYSATMLSSIFLKELVKQVEAKSKLEIESAIITVPAYFTEVEKQNTRKAAEKAGIKVIRLINEPTAAAIAYGLSHTDTVKNILVYDLGGGTFDVTLASIYKDTIDVVATNGDHHLGGKDWDERLCDWMLEQFQDEFGIDLRDSQETVKSTMVSAEKAKRRLTDDGSIEVRVETNGKLGSYQLTEEIFRDLTADLLEKTQLTIDEMFENCGKSWRDVDDVILVGGSTRMRMISDYIVDMTGKPPLCGLNADEAVAIGAAIQANIESKRRLAVPDGTKKLNWFVPNAQQKDICIPGEIKVNDVISHTLGMVAVSEDGTKFINDIMIPRNTPISKAYITKVRELGVSKNKSQNELDVYLVQGDSRDPSCCNIAKKYVFRDIDYVDGGKTRLDITYFHTESGTIDVQAIQKETGKELVCAEEPLEEDMSWLLKPPAEVYGTASAGGVLIMAIDLSYSMAKDPVRQAMKAMKSFVDQFDLDVMQIGIAGFGTSAAMLLAPTSDKYLLYNKIDELAQMVEDSILGAGTSAQPLTLVREKLQDYDEYDYLYAVVLTDGMWSGPAKKKSYEEKNLYIKNGFEIVALGFGTAEERFLKDISTREDLAKFDDISALSTNLSKIARVITDGFMVSGSF